MSTPRDLTFTPAVELRRLYRARKVSPLAPLLIYMDAAPRHLSSATFARSLTPSEQSIA
jgi:hypothetical protein